MPVVKKFNNGVQLEFAQGSFDKWCVYLIDSNGKRTPPKDKEYFTYLKHIATTYPENKVFNDIVYVYNMVTKNSKEDDFNNISLIASSYREDDRFDMELNLCIIYMAMIAEENKKNTRLGKKIKMLGLYQLLKENYTPGDAAFYSVGKRAEELLEECKLRNIF